MAEVAQGLPARTDRPTWPEAPPADGPRPVEVLDRDSSRREATRALGSPRAPGHQTPRWRYVVAACLGSLLVLFLAATVIGALTVGFSDEPTVQSDRDVSSLSSGEVEGAGRGESTEGDVGASSITSPDLSQSGSPSNLSDDLGSPHVEPVVAAARAVGPSVVLITNLALGEGSGIIYDAQGLILTNAHVVGGATEVRVQLASGVVVEGEVLGADPRTDVAVVSISPEEDFGVATLAPASSVEVGQLAVAIGSPFGLEQTVTAGVVSAVGRVVENLGIDGAPSIVAMIQTDAPINPGNSGGALADREGRVVGMNTAIRTNGSGVNAGVGFAIPSDTAKLIADRIIAGEPLDQGFLGISGESPTMGTPGALILDVTSGSGAEIGGLLSHDLIVGFDGELISSMIDLAAAVRLQRPGAQVTIDFLRDDRPMSVEITLGGLPDAGFIAISGEAATGGIPGVVVSEVTPGSGADRAGLLSRDVILAFEGEPVSSMRDLTVAASSFAPGGVVEIEILRDGRRLLVEIVLDERPG